MFYRFMLTTITLLGGVTGLVAQTTDHAYTTAVAPMSSGNVTDTNTGTLYAHSAVAGGGFHNSVPFMAEASATASGLSVPTVGASGYEQGPAGSSTLGSATWRDRIVITGPSSTIWPDYVDMHFSAAGSVGLIYRDPQNSPLGIIAVFANGSFWSEYRVNADGESIINYSGTWDTFSSTGSSFQGTYHVRVPFSDGNTTTRIGDWWFRYDAYAAAGTSNICSINGGDPPTVSFTLVTMPDGTSLESHDLTFAFASGASTTVPEPSGLLLTAMAAVAGIVISSSPRGGEGRNLSKVVQSFVMIATLLCGEINNLAML
jgi:hypothetical protein